MRTPIEKLVEETLAVASGMVTLKVHWTLFPFTLACTLLALHVEVNGVNWLFARVAQMNVISVLFTLAQQYAVSLPPLPGCKERHT